MIGSSPLARTSGLLLVVLALAAAPEPVTVEPWELVRHPELLGREVTVDGRIQSFQYREGIMKLRRCPVLYRLPPRLRFDQTPPRSTTVRMTGTLRREGEEWACDVTAMELLPSDLARVRQGVDVLPAEEFEVRAAWARWAERRAREYHDERDHDDELLALSRSIAGDAIRLEAERPSPDPPSHWMRLARKARSLQVPEPEPSALAHRAFRVRLAGATTAADLATLRSEIEGFFPEAATPATAGDEMAPWARKYADEPALAYRAAPVGVRADFDHRLWADATARLLGRQSEDDPKGALALADRAAALLPDRPEVAARLLEQGIKIAASDLGSLREAEVDALVRIYRERLRQPDRGRALVRDWLDDRRRRLSPTDAEGRIALASRYETFLDDRVSAVELLREAWKIAPDLKEVSDAFRRRGFRKLNDEWVATDRAGNDTRTAESPASTASGDSLLGSTPKQVRARLGGRPTRVARSGSQGRLVEQWIYVGATQDQYINFAHRPGDLVARVVASYSRPHSAGVLPPR